jgi:hypothetical protein
MQTDDIQSHNNVTVAVTGQKRKSEQKITIYLSLLKQETHSVQLAETATYYNCSTQPKISEPTAVLTSEWYHSMYFQTGLDIHGLHTRSKNQLFITIVNLTSVQKRNYIFWY